MDWSPYYQNLSPALKKRFILRCIRFYRSVDFTAHDTMELSRQMKIIICSAFTQITFGLKKHKLSDFTEIHLMPTKYTYGNDVHYSGDVNRGTFRITLSWKAVQRGFEIHDDALNVCIHEFGHCLLLENRSSFIYYYFNHDAWEEYKLAAKRKFKKLKSGQASFLRDYAGSNLMELFSVSLEAFFEQAYEFSAQEPELYRAMTRLLNQDPRMANRPLLNRNGLF